jgi:hypothetical protein
MVIFVYCNYRLPPTQNVMPCAPTSLTISFNDNRNQHLIYAVRYATGSARRGECDGASGLVCVHHVAVASTLRLQITYHSRISAVCAPLHADIASQPKAVRPDTRSDASRPNGLSRSECTVAIWSPSSARTVDVTTSTVHGCTVGCGSRPVALLNVQFTLGKSGSTTSTCQQ